MKGREGEGREENRRGGKEKGKKRERREGDGR